MKRLAIIGFFVFVYCLANSLIGFSASRKAPLQNAREALALIGAKIYPSPAEKPIANGVVLIRNGKIVAVGEQGKIAIPQNIKKIDCAGLTLTAGFWNSHVHFTEVKWEKAATLPAAQLTEQLQQMLTRYGVTTVFDTGSYWEITSKLRQRIEAGEVKGPKIYTAGEILFPKGGRPPEALLKASGTIVGTMPEVETVEQALAVVRQKLDSGVDGIKLYAQTFWDANLKLSPEVIRAVTLEAHRRGKPVLVHPSNTFGFEAAIDSGVDVLVHTTPQIGLWSAAQLAKMKAAHMALIPTLKLWRIEAERGGAPAEAVRRFQGRGVDQLRAYFQTGGQILFGTDIGYINDYDPTEEYEQMQQAGMQFQDILAALTINPAARFGASRHTGKIAPGMDADVVLLSSDPAQSVKAFADVRYTLRRGEIIYQSK
jgi:imidazolonepropionase-like amidohydrolase